MIMEDCKELNMTLQEATDDVGQESVENNDRWLLCLTVLL